jgi:glutamine amidotransferase
MNPALSSRKSGMKIAIVDYGASNLQSVANALTSLGQTFEVVSDPKGLAGFDKVIVPGVGAAGSAMKKLRETGFADVLPSLTVPVLGLCLGMQLFAEWSEEDETKCLSVIPGTVRRFVTELKVPHMGWNTVQLTRDSKLTEGVPDGSFFYFVHSYYLPDGEYSIGATSYGASFAAIVQKDNFYGTQFHPEKSGQWGMKILDNFCRL